MSRWQDEAACRGVDSRDIYPEDNDPAIMEWFAFVYCKTCPVKAPCLAEAIKHKDQYGVWGGVTPGQGERAI